MGVPVNEEAPTSDDAEASVVLWMVLLAVFGAGPEWILTFHTAVEIDVEGIT